MEKLASLELDNKIGPAFQVVLDHPIKLILAGLVGLNFLLQAKRYLEYVSTHGRPTYTVLFAPLSALGVVFTKGLIFQWTERYKLYKDGQTELISLVPVIWGTPTFYSNSMEVIRQISGSGTDTGWEKPLWSSAASLYWGENVLAVNGHQWRRHRRIIQPAFNPGLYDLVWKETNRLYHDMIAKEAWPTTPGETVSTPVVQRIATQLALGVILSAGFGLPSAWVSPKAKVKETIGSGSVQSQLSIISDAITLQGDNMLLVAIAPNWIYYIPGKLKKIKAALNALQSWFNVTVTQKKNVINAALEGVELDSDAKGDANVDADTDMATDADKDDPFHKSVDKDIFSRIVLASQKDQRFRLDDKEIIGNTWVMIFAGHESTAGTIAATLAFLALYPKEQQEIYQEIVSVTSEFNCDTSRDGWGVEAYDKLVKTRSAFAEALRMIPPASVAIRQATHDTIIKVPCSAPSNGAGKDVKGANGVMVEKDVLIKKGTVLIGDLLGVQYNPRYYPEPHLFKPSRWYNHGSTSTLSSGSDDMYTAFSNGPRTCIGRKFALTEAVCFLANLLRDFEVTPLLKNKESGKWKETLEEWRKRVLDDTSFGLTLVIQDAPLVFKRR